MEDCVYKNKNRKYVAKSSLKKHCSNTGVGICRNEFLQASSPWLAGLRALIVNAYEVVC